MTDVELARALERCEVPNEGFHHADHLRVAWVYLQESASFDEAAARMESTLKARAGAAGVPEKYHHTVTLFWMRMIARLMDKELSLSYYSSERLSSDAARLGWLEPDLRPLDDEGDSVSHRCSPARAVRRRSGRP